MTVGERIQMYRKQLAMSQEELCQKLLISKQTINLWEKDEVMPTIDNLIGLKEIFDASVDDILGNESEFNSTEILPNEVYMVHFDKSELNEIYHLQKKPIYTKAIIFALICLFLLILLISSSAPDVIISFVLAVFLMCTVSHIIGIRSYRKVWLSNIERIYNSTYVYEFFEDYVSINIYRQNKKVSKLKCFFTDIERIQQFDRWLFLQFGGQTFILRKSELNEVSVLYSYMYKNPSKIVDTAVSGKLGTVSFLLFIASLLSILGSLSLFDIISKTNGLFIENMWVFFLMTPIPLSSVIFGFILKSKGLKYRKNIVAGVIMTVLLCIYGSFVFFF